MPTQRPTPLDYGLVLPLALSADSRVPHAETGAATPAEYDGYFRIIRRDLQPSEWLAGCCRLQDEIVGDLQTSTLTADERCAMLRGFLLVLRVSIESAGGDVRLAPDVGDAAPHPINGSPLSPAQERASRRWKLGHHLFHTYLVVMNTILDDGLTQVREACWPRLIEDIWRLVDLYHAATASMKYASDFPREIYQELIRPSMSPPGLSPGFSGLLNQEHATLLRQLEAFRRARAGLKGDAPLVDACRAAERALRLAERDNRRSHALVCSRFVPGGASLLAQFQRDRRREAGPDGRAPRGGERSCRHTTQR